MSWTDRGAVTESPDVRRIRYAAAVSGYALCLAATLLLTMLGTMGVAHMPSAANMQIFLPVGAILLVAVALELRFSREAIAGFTALYIGFYPTGFYVHEQTTAAVFVAPALALMLVGPVGLVVSAVLPIAVLAARGGAASPYLDPLFLVLAGLIDGSMLLGQLALRATVRAVEDRTALLLAVTSDTGDVVLIRDVDGFTRYVSPSVLRVLGYEPEAFRKLMLEALVHPDDQARFAALFSHIADAPGESVTAEMRLRHNDGQYRWADTRTTNLVAHRDVHGYVTSFADVTAKVNARLLEGQRLEERATIDTLTKLPNRQAVLDRLEASMTNAKALGRSLALLFCDLDHFKDVNDSLGHDAGDSLLSAVAAELRALTPAEHLVGRFGGDEFVVICDGVSPQAASELAEALVEAVRARVLSRGPGLAVTMSVGVALYDGQESADALLRDADIAMYVAKSSGRNLATCFDTAMRARAYRRHDLERALWRAIEHGELELRYLPKLRVDGELLMGFEALIRWRSPTFGELAPAEFLTLAEESGAIAPIGQWVLDQCCQVRRAWRERFPNAEVAIAMNVSRRQLLQPSIVDDVQSALARYRLISGDLEIEVSESTALEDVTTATMRLKQLKRLGVRVAIDNFGSGASSLAHLRRMPVDALKIDRSFVSALGRDKEQGEVVCLAITLARALGWKTVAEGVETAVHLEVLRALGCHAAQGFYFSQPLTREDAEAYLAAHSGERLAPRRVRSLA